MTAATPPLFPGAPGALPARSLRDMLGAAWRQLPLILGCTALLTLLALWLYYQQPRVYTSKVEKAGFALNAWRQAWRRKAIYHAGPRDAALWRRPA